ncbi:hypothetical protein TTHERM_00616500 (macronuclear) [Tetrahymena thermophila SB210]|uniref:Uncharacterized protein n=1 Tax=Tetrahymena thermophila (strain SB210) TaxID=312017 RepID=I7MII7_TETTS|nr:hypothetical protein TTHERM_00616500 [Tetrahymena thermophila SB210]EAS04475.4 hypothetical protein TTHERM_00616500 [Tetrahymena thermophila SB210]|eukprot:XP_001024720.4 hypothetical protein TTHERM_00616500 [Tetrahymena thermophila SB210]
MIQLLKKRRSQWFFESSQEFTEQEIHVRQEILSKQEQKNMEFWQKCKELKKRPHLFQTEKKIDLDHYQEKDFDEKDVIVIPISTKKNNLIINLEDSPIRHEDHQLVVLEDINDCIDISQDNIVPNFQIERANGNLLNIQIEKDNEITSEKMINDTFQAVKDNHEESKVNEDINASQDTTIFNRTLVQQFINERKQAITENQVAIEENIDKTKEATTETNFNLQTEKQVQIQHQINENQMQDISFNQGKAVVSVSSSNNLSENQKIQRPIVIEEDKINEEQNKLDDECQEDQANWIWLPLKAPQQIPISYFADWKFKGQDKVNLEYGKNYDASTIFRMLFTQPLYTHIIQNIYKKFNKRITKRNIFKDPIEINSYDIDAYISLLLHSQCLQHPNLINTINKINQDMDHHILEFIQNNFSVGAKVQDENGCFNEIAKIEQFISMVNQRLKQLVQPKEYLQLLHKTIEGNYFKSNSQYFLDEFRLYDYSNSFIVDVQFDKSTPELKKSQDYVQKLMRVQANVLDNYKGKGHKVVIQNQLFDADILRSLRHQNIGVVTRSHIENIQFTPKQLKIISENKLFKNFFFIYEREVQAVITPYSFSHKYAFISNFLGLEDTKDLANPKMQQIYSEKGVVLDYKDINPRDVEGVKWDQLVFLRVLDVIVKNTHSLYQYINNDSKITKEQIIKDLKKQFLQSYQAHRELQHKICIEKISTSKDFRVHFWEENQGGKKQECIVCHTKTRNYCIQCSEKKKQIIGFCGNSNCLQKHNELPAKLLNQQFQSVDVDKKKNQYDRPYESASESGGGFKSKLGFRPFDSNKDQSSFKSSSMKRLDGYQSEAVSSIKSKNFSIYQHDDGFKSDAGTSFNIFSHKKKNNESQTFKTIQQLAKEHDSQFNSSKNIRSYNNENSSLADEIINVYQKKKTASSNNLDKNSQETQLPTKDASNQLREEDKNYASGSEKVPLKLRDFAQLKSKGSLSDIEGQSNNRNQDNQGRGETKNNQEKKKRQSKVPWYNTEMEEEEDRKFKEQDRRNAQQILQNPKVREILFESDNTKRSLAKKLEKNQKMAIESKLQEKERKTDSNKQQQQFSNTHHQSKKQVFQFEQEDHENQIEKEKNSFGGKNQNFPEQKTKSEVPNILQQSQSFGIQATPTLGDNQTASFSAQNQLKDKNNLKETATHVEKKRFQFEEEEDDAPAVQNSILSQEIKQLSKSQQSIHNSIQESQNNKILNNQDLENSLKISSQQSLSKKLEKDKSNNIIIDTQSNQSSESKGKIVQSQQKFKSTSLEKSENSLQGIIKIQKGSFQNMEEVQNGLQNIEKDNQNQKLLETSNISSQMSKQEIINQETKKQARTIIKALQQTGNNQLISNK